MQDGTTARRVCAATLSASTGDEPAREVRLYHYGWNDDTTGSLLFDEEAAKLVMAAFERKSVAGMVDLEHMSLDDTAPNWDADARGSYRLEVRKDANGKPELWAVIDWAPEGEQRIREKRQRFLSPVVQYATDSKRILRIFNIALCANPATHGAQPLIAATERTRTGTVPASRKGRKMASEKVTAETLTKLMEAYGLAPDAGVGELTALLQATVTELQGGTPEPTEPTEGDALADGPKPEAGKEEDPDHVMAAASHKLMRVGLKSVAKNLDAIAVGVAMVLRKTGTKTLNAALDRIDAFKSSHLAAEEGTAKLKAGQAKLEEIERRQLVGQLVVLKSETPATAFVDTLIEPGVQPTICKRLADEPIDELRTRVAKLNGGKPVATATRANGDQSPKPPKGAAPGAEGLTERELRICKEKKIDPADYAAKRAAIRARSVGASAQEG